MSLYPISTLQTAVLHTSQTGQITFKTQTINKTTTFFLTEHPDISLLINDHKTHITPLTSGSPCRRLDCGQLQRLRVDSDHVGRLRGGDDPPPWCGDVQNFAACGCWKPHKATYMSCLLNTSKILSTNPTTTRIGISHHENCLFVSCLTPQQHASVSQGRHIVKKMVMLRWEPEIKSC